MMTRYRVAVHIVLRKGVLDSQGKRIAESKEVQRDGLDLPVTWRSEFQLPGEPVALRIKLRNATSCWPIPSPKTTKSQE